MARESRAWKETWRGGLSPRLQKCILKVGVPNSRNCQKVGVPNCPATQRQAIVAPLDVAQAWSRTHRYPVFVGEFGAYSRAPAASRIAFNRFMRDAAEARGMRWQYWEFASGFGVYDPGADTFRAELLDSLVGGDAAASPQPAKQPRPLPQSRPVGERPRNAPDRRLAPSQRER